MEKTLPKVLNVEIKTKKPVKFSRELLYRKFFDLMYFSKATHVGSCLSCFDILIQTLIFEMIKEDKFLLSKGHAAPAFYVILNYLGVISDKKLSTFLQNGTELPAHTPNHFYNSHIHFPTGSLGHGLSLASGMAHAQKLNLRKGKNKAKVFCLISDGECNEGQVWEAAQYASAMKLNNLFVLVDHNGFQAFGKTADVLGETTGEDRWKSFGFDVFRGNGHSLGDIANTFLKAKALESDKPKVLIFDTVKGKGVASFENKLESHYKLLTEEDHKAALEKLLIQS